MGRDHSSTPRAKPTLAAAGVFLCRKDTHRLQAKCNGEAGEPEVLRQTGRRQRASSTLPKKKALYFSTRGFGTLDKELNFARIAMERKAFMQRTAEAHQ
jgi:hypothetical protein